MPRIVPVSCTPLRSRRSATHFSGDIFLKPLAHTLERDPLKDRVEESFNDELLGLRQRDAPRAQIEERLFLQLTHRCAVGATDVVGEDLQAGDGVGAGALAEDEVAIGLVAIRL